MNTLSSGFPPATLLRGARVAHPKQWGVRLLIPQPDGHIEEVVVLAEGRAAARQRLATMTIADDVTAQIVYRHCDDWKIDTEEKR